MSTKAPSSQEPTSTGISGNRTSKTLPQPKPKGHVNYILQWKKNHFPNFPLLYDNPLRFELTRKIPPKGQQCPNYSQLRSSHLASIRNYFKNFYNNPDHMINKLPKGSFDHP
ncbi:hypothetical protein RCL1_007278 [Eukaryota sp. TZLM3-RCL]